MLHLKVATLFDRRIERGVLCKTNGYCKKCHTFTFLGTHAFCLKRTPRVEGHVDYKDGLTFLRNNHSKINKTETNSRIRSFRALQIVASKCCEHGI